MPATRTGQPSRDADAPLRRVAEALAGQAHGALLAELHTWPKPGLVSPVDSGSHHDMDCATFEASAASLHGYFFDIAMAGARDKDMRELRLLGMAAERAMMAATGGVNTHRGAIFGMGLLCAAAGYRAATGEPGTLGQLVARRWGRDIAGGPRPADSNGMSVQRRYGAGGARAEAATGFPSVYRIALPAMRRARIWRPGDAQAPAVQALFALIARVQDTNLLHRGGPEGMNWARDSARGFLARGGVRRAAWRHDAAAVHRRFVARGLSPGGCADLLAMALFLRDLEAHA
ncbi:triphosphoribosyl-dephospho-CoA synthase [Bordetella sp. H567]|uniref:triphosphoribosyl-dephospho-CoA synthase MdcB n=1 Tax=Bordetella sp. H567 TaxID=1697043 RepID=UPI00081C4F9E|nr:triphosphoribosyl-dephospho-CoA synthase MdcB [Bordetella sp. H567]AOB33950.1 triphosphoribosyl-dephospho-CoA synthase [Bordetella sp. H567]